MTAAIEKGETVQKDAIALYNDELELRDEFAGRAMQALITAKAGLPEQGFEDPHRFIAVASFDVAKAMILERRRRTPYTCTNCGRAAMKEGSERCPECAKIACVRCTKPIGEFHHICIREVAP